MGIKGSKWQTHLAAAQASGLSLAGYAAQHGINVRRLYETRHARARAKAAKVRKASGFVRIKLKPESPAIVIDAHQPRAVATPAMAPAPRVNPFFASSPAASNSSSKRSA